MLLLIPTPLRSLEEIATPESQSIESGSAEGQRVGGRALHTQIADPSKINLGYEVAGTSLRRRLQRVSPPKLATELYGYTPMKQHTCKLRRKL